MPFDRLHGLRNTDDADPWSRRGVVAKLDRSPDRVSAWPEKTCRGLIDDDLGLIADAFYEIPAGDDGNVGGAEI